jgi:hypothetical protein
MIDGVRWLADTSPANWINPLLHPPFVDTGSIVPVGFESYCRIFHPIRSRELGSGMITWAELATRNDRHVHPEMQFHAISTPRGTPSPQTYERGIGPEWGSLPLEERFELIRQLGPATQTRERCWFLMWEGFGDVSFGSAARVEIGQRDYAMYAGPIEAAAISLNDRVPSNSPNMWWPEDRAWIVVTDIDFAWTYVGGHEDIIGRLVSSQTLEAFPCQITDKPFYNSDTLNK